MATRAQQRDTTEAAIIAAGLRILSEEGADALTIRGLARALHLAPSALYRYVTNRNDLIRLLLAHSYSDLADTIQAAHDAVPRSDITGRWRAFAFTLRSWSQEHRHEWVMIQRSVMGGPRTFGEHTFRLHRLLIRLGADAEAAGIYPTIAQPDTPSALPGLKHLLAASGVEVSEQTALAGLAAWHLLDGAIYAELLELAGVELFEPDAYYAAMVSATEKLLLRS